MDRTTLLSIVVEICLLRAPCFGHKNDPDVLVTTLRYCAAEANILGKLIRSFPVKWQFLHYVDIRSCLSRCPQEPFAIASYKQRSSETGSDVIAFLCQVLWEKLN